jgi:hypothetical protein
MPQRRGFSVDLALVLAGIGVTDNIQPLREGTSDAAS